MSLWATCILKLRAITLFSENPLKNNFAMDKHSPMVSQNKVIFFCFVEHCSKKEFLFYSEFIKLQKYRSWCILFLA